MTKTDIIIAHAWIHGITIKDIPSVYISYNDMKGIPRYISS